jgi:UDP-glucose 4-epimerase
MDKKLKKQRKILVTGGAGFIGSHLIERLLTNPVNSVYVLDDLSTGRISNIRPFLKNKKFKFIKGSILNKKVFKRLSKPDWIFHLAAAVGAKLVVEKPLDSFRTNIIGTENMLEFALKSKSKILIASSSETYGKNISIPFKETDDRIYGSVYNPRWGYAISKSCDELMAIFYHKELGLDTVVVRLFNTVGPRQVGDYGMVIPTLTKQALRSEPITIYGNGKQIRSFTYVGDVVDAFVKLMNKKEAVGRIINIGSENSVSIKELGRRIKKLTKSQSEIQYIPYTAAYSSDFEEMMKRKPDISEARKLIDFKPLVDLDEILKKVIEHIRNS